MAEHFPHHAGHGLGLTHPEAPYLVRHADETLLAGDVVTLEPGLYVAGVGGIRIEHNYLITRRRLRAAEQPRDRAEVRDGRLRLRKACEAASGLHQFVKRADGLAVAAVEDARWRTLPRKVFRLLRGRPQTSGGANFRTVHASSRPTTFARATQVDRPCAWRASL